MKPAGNWLLAFLTVCVGLAFLKVALSVLAVGLALALIYLFVTRPRETLLYIGAVGLFELASARPATCIIAMATVALAVVAVGAWAKPRQRRQLLLMNRRDDL